MSESNESPPTTTHRPWWRLNWLGLLASAVVFGWALTPSLLPRPWLFEGIIAGLGAALGYALGCLLSWAARAALRGREPGPGVKRWAWRILAVAGPVLATAYLIAGIAWQNQVRELVGQPDEGFLTAFVVGAVALVTAVVALAVGRGVRAVFRRLRRLLDRFVPTWLAAGLSTVVLVAVLAVLVNGILIEAFTATMDRLYSGTNDTTAEGISPPVQPQRSGSPESLVAWDTLGLEGRNFVARGPSVAQLTTFSGRAATEPIRVYVGLESADDAAARADLAVQELERTGAFDRAVLVVAGTTGTGWLEPQSTDSLEYTWNGDTAIVGIQYSYLPSWISTVVDVDRAAEAGRSVFDAVHARWAQLPEGSRPKLIAYGLSLGSFSIQSAFADATDLTDRVQGAVLTGSPSFSEPRRTLLGTRDPGSAEWKPVVDGGALIRFGGTAADLEQPSNAWGAPRIAYLQHANDPVVWWSAELIWSQPDWLREPPGPARTDLMSWYPVLTFLQVTVDQFVGVDVPDGQGHNYGGTMPAVWDLVTDPPDWGEDDVARLTRIVLGQPIE